MDTVQPDIRLLLAPDAAAPAIARDAVGSTASLSGGPAAIMALLVSELVENSVLHSAAGPDATIELRAWVRTQPLRVEVIDEGAGFDASVALASPQSDGLLLVDELSTGWGVTREDERTCVWFELAGLPRFTRPARDAVRDGAPADSTRP